MKFTSLHKMLLSIALIAMGFVAFALASPKNWDDEANKRKAEYLFYESQNSYSDGDFDDYVTMMHRAYLLDSTDVDISAEWGLVLLADKYLDSLSEDKAYNMVKRRFIADPSNYLSGIVFANVAKRQNKFKDVVRVWEMLDSANPSLNQPAEELAQAYLISYIVGDSAAYDKALKIYDRLERGAGKNIGLSSQKIRAYMVKSDTASMLKEIDDLVEFAPKDAYIMLFAGTNYQYLGDNEKALEYFNRSCELDSTNGAAFMMKAGLYNEMGDSVAFDREVFHALQSPNLEVESKLEILHSYVSQLYTDTTQEKRIRQLFTELANMHPGEAEIYNLYASYLYEIKDYKGASEALTYSVSLAPQDERSWTSLIQTLAYDEDNEAIVKYAAEAKDRFPDNLYFPIVEAQGYHTLQQTDKALVVLDSVKFGEIANPRAVSNFISFKGDLLAVVGDTVKALEAYDEAIDLDPENLLALNNAAYFMAVNGTDLDKAERYSSKAVRFEPENPTYLDTYAWVFFKKKEYSLARQYIDITLNIYKKNAEKKITIPVEKLNELQGDSAAMADFMTGLISEAVGSDASGNEEDQAVEGQDDDENEPSADVYEHAGDIYFMDGEPQKALEFWKLALEQDPDNELLKKKVQYRTYFYQ